MRIELLQDYIFAEPTPFYQMKEWSDLARQEGLETFHLAIKDEDEIVIFALILKYPLIGPFHQLYIPRGPVVFRDEVSGEAWKLFEKAVQDIAQKTTSIFTLIEPDEISKNSLESLSKISRKALKQRLPHQTIKIDTTREPEEILESMHKKTRYNIRLSVKKNTICERIETSSEKFEESFSAFFKLLKKTAERGKFRIHAQEHYRKILESTSGDFHPFLIQVSHNDTVIASHMYLSIPKEVIYLHGASSEKYRECMAPYRIQWEAINYAHEHGKDWLDLWGISDTNPDWEGITRFKRRFNGKEISYPDSRLIIHSKPIYLIYQLRNKILGRQI
jgi:lipid II:glycine glycyltransferase (peptidoglycan interpeptide bridge formation enzyme)